MQQLINFILGDLLQLVVNMVLFFVIFVMAYNGETTHKQTQEIEKQN